MDAEELGRRLRAAREARGLTQQAAADALDLPRTAVTQMEAGNRAVSTLELSRLAELYVYPAAAFLQESTWDEDVLVALYRVAPGLERDPATHREVVRCVSLFREGVALETFLGGNRRACAPSYETPHPALLGKRSRKASKLPFRNAGDLALATRPSQTWPNLSHPKVSGRPA